VSILQDCKTVKSKSFSFGNFEVKVQFNPARMFRREPKRMQKVLLHVRVSVSSNRPQQQKLLISAITKSGTPLPYFP
jgi:hypothetical protein